MRILCAAVAAVSSLFCLTAGAAGAQAKTNPCQPVSFSPSTVVLGESALVKTFDVATQSSSCDSEGWHLTVPALDIDVAGGVGLRGQSHTFFPDDFMHNGDTLKPGPYTVHVDQLDGSFNSYSATFTFSLVSRTDWGSSFNAGPEPVHKGSSIKLTGRLYRAIWGFPHGYQGYANRHVSVQFAPAGSTAYTDVKVLALTATGALSGSVTATKSGTWRMHYNGNPTAAGAYSNPDYVAVT